MNNKKPPCSYEGAFRKGWGIMFFPTTTDSPTQTCPNSKKGLWGRTRSELVRPGYIVIIVSDTLYSIHWVHATDEFMFLLKWWFWEDISHTGIGVPVWLCLILSCNSPPFSRHTQKQTWSSLGTQSDLNGKVALWLTSHWVSLRLHSLVWITP